MDITEGGLWHLHSTLLNELINNGFALLDGIEDGIYVVAKTGLVPALFAMVLLLVAAMLAAGGASRAFSTATPALSSARHCVMNK